MRERGWFGGVVAAWLAACSASNAFAQDAPAGPCGGFEAAPLTTAAVGLLQDRLRIVSLDGMREGLPIAANTSELIADSGAHRLVVVAKELFSRPTPDLFERVAQTQGSMRGLRSPTRRSSDGVRSSEVVLPSGLRTVLEVDDTPDMPDLPPDVPKDSNEGVAYVAHAVVVLPDSTLVEVDVVVRPSVMRAGGSGCAALALRLLRSLAPGERSLETAAGTRRLRHARVTPSA